MGSSSMSSACIMGSSSTTFAVLLVGAMLAVSANGDAEDGRLTYAHYPYHYNLEQTPDIYRTNPPFPFSGNVQIFFTCIVASTVVTINFKELTIDNFSVKLSLVPGQDGNLPIPILKPWTVDTPSELLYFPTTDLLTQNVSYILEMKFTGIISDDEYGLYYDKYNSSDGNIKYMAGTHFQPHGGRITFPCFDEPDFKATFNTTIIRKPPAVSVANTPLLQTIDRGDEWVADVYHTTPMMSLYLVAFAVGDFQKLSAGAINGYQVNIWARPEIIPQMNWSLNTAPTIQAWLDNETGITYREAKSDHIAFPNKGEAIENWGLMTYGDGELAVNPETSLAFGVRYVASFIAHEAAHLWYGNLVTCRWWDDLWLNEGFATYYDYRPTQSLGWEGSEASQVETQNFMENDQRNSSDPVRKLIPTVWKALSAFRGSTYPKGGAMVRMLEGILTTPTFQAGIKRYLQTNQYNTATTDDLWQALTDQAAIDGITNPNGSALDVKRRMDPWLNQTGFPFVSVVRHDDGTANLFSLPFLRPRGQIMNKCEWDVPITIVSADSGPEAWDAPPSAWIDIGVTVLRKLPGFPTNLSRWAIINAKFSMYYRVWYDEISHAAIVSQLLLDNTAIHVESRSQIIDDAFSIARIGYTLETTAMETIRYLANEEKWGPWNAALRHLMYSDRLLRQQSWRGLQRNYILSLAIPVYQRLGWNYTATETPFQKFLRRDMIAVTCSYGHADCLSKARSQYALIVPNPAANVVDPNNLPTVLCVGVREGTEADWQLSFDQYLARKTSQIREERYAYLYGAACTNDTTLLDRLLVELGSSVATRDRNRLAHYLSQSDYGAQILWDYLDVNWNNHTSGLHRMWVLRNIALGFSTRAEYDKLLDFKAKNPPKSQEVTFYTNLILDVNNNILWLNGESVKLQEWLEDHQPLESAVRMVNGRPYELPVSPMEHWQAVHKSYHSEFNHF